MKGQEETQTGQPPSLPILGRSEQGDVAGDSSVTHMAWPCPALRTRVFEAAVSCAEARGFILGCPVFHPLSLSPSCLVVCIAGVKVCLQRG